MEEKKEKKSKKTNVLNIILYAILVVLGLAVCAYSAYKIGYEYGSQVGNEKQQVEEPKEESRIKYEAPKGLNKDSLMVKDLMRPFFYSDCNVDLGKLDEFETRMQVALTQVSVNQVQCKEIEPKYFFDKDNIPYACSQVLDTGENVPESEMKFDESRLTNETTNVIDANQMKYYYQRIFGQKSDYKNTDFKQFIYYYKYDSNGNRFVMYSRLRTGGTCSGGPEIKYDSVTQNGNDLTIVLKSNKTITYTFTFEEDTGNYIFVNRVES